MLLFGVGCAVALSGAAWAGYPLFLEAKAKAAVRSSLRDPSSATFRSVRAHHRRVVCGEVNAKNGFGAYGGHRRFVWLAGRAYLDADFDLLESRVELAREGQRAELMRDLSDYQSFLMYAEYCEWEPVGLLRTRGDLVQAWDDRLVAEQSRGADSNFRRAMAKPLTTPTLDELEATLPPPRKNNSSDACAAAGELACDLAGKRQ